MTCNIRPNNKQMFLSNNYMNNNWTEQKWYMWPNEKHEEESTEITGGDV